MEYLIGICEYDHIPLASGSLWFLTLIASIIPPKFIFPLIFHEIELPALHFIHCSIDYLDPMISFHCIESMLDLGSISWRSPSLVYLTPHPGGENGGISQMKAIFLMGDALGRIISRFLTPSSLFFGEDHLEPWYSFSTIPNKLIG